MTARLHKYIEYISHIASHPVVVQPTFILLLVLCPSISKKSYCVVVQPTLKNQHATDSNYALQTAIATSLNLRCFGVLSGRQDSKVALAAPDLEADYAWEVSALPWDAVPKRSRGDASAPKELVAGLLSAIEELVAKANLTRTGTSASTAFLYIYMAMAGTKSEA